MVARVDGTQVGTVQVSNDENSDPTGTYNVGATPGRGVFTPLKFGSHLIYNVTKTDSELADIESSLDSIYGGGIL
jgi:hypothetical protein